MTLSIRWPLTAVLCTLACCGGEQGARHESAIGELASFAGLEGSLDLAGGTAHIPVMTAAAERIMKACPGIRITVAGGGSGVGIQMVGEGLVHIGNAGRPVTEAENRRYGLTSYAFAVDGVATIVHPGNPVRELTSRQVRDIFAGRLTNWSEVGGEDAGINLYGRDEASGTRKVYWKIALGKGEVATSANVVQSNGAMKTAVSRDENAIGYMSIGHVDETVAALKLDGVAPTQENARNGTYKVTRRLFMNTKGAPGPLAKALIEYICGGDGAQIVADCGYIPIQ
jgi:phosphate transport system substrate-binding protein